MHRLLPDTVAEQRDGGACRPEGGVGPGEYFREREPEGPAYTIPGARRGSVEAREATAGPGEYHGCGLHNPGAAWTMGQKPKARVCRPAPAARPLAVLSCVTQRCCCAVALLVGCAVQGLHSMVALISIFFCFYVGSHTHICRVRHLQRTGALS